MSLGKAAALTLLAAVVQAGAPLAQTYPHSFPRDGVTKLFETERLAVWEVNWKHGIKHPIHRHQFDMASIFLRWGPVQITQPNGTAGAVGGPFEVPDPYFQRKGVTHKEEGVGKPGDPERLAITVDLKDVTVAPFHVTPGQLTAFPREGATDVLDNERVRIWDYRWEPKRAVAMHVHDMDAVEVFVEPGTILTKTPDGKEEKYTVAFKQARLVPRGTVRSEEAVAGSPRAFVIQLK